MTQRGSDQPRLEGGATQRKGSSCWVLWDKEKCARWTRQTGHPRQRGGQERRHRGLESLDALGELAGDNRKRQAGARILKSAFLKKPLCF